MASILESLGLTQDHYDRIAEMKADPASFGITSQYDYAKQSGKDLVSRSAPGLGVVSALGQTAASPFYDAYQASKDPNRTFLGEKPFTMAAGRFMGGLEALGERYGIIDPYADIKGQTAFMPLGTMISGAKGIFGGKSGAAVMKKMSKDVAAQKAIEKMMRQKIEQEMAERAARENARRMSMRNRFDNTGGYQAGYSDDFMSGSGTAAEMGSS